MMQRRGVRIFLGVLGVLFLLGFDQGSKSLAVARLRGKPAIPVFSGVFELRYLENTGAAFGILQDQRLLLLLFTLLIFAALVVVYLRIPAERHYLPLRCICVLAGAGAIGNMEDRFLNGYVVDFFYFSLIDFPIFNVADCYVTIACVLLLLFVLFFYKEEDFAFLWSKRVGNDRK